MSPKLTHWLVPANNKYSDIFSAFEQDEIYWPINAKINACDIIYIYLTTPFKQIGYVCSVTEIGFATAEILHVVRPFVRGNIGFSNSVKSFMKLSMKQRISIDQNNLLSLHNLKLNGLNGMLMGVRKLENNQVLFNYSKRSLA